MKRDQDKSRASPLLSLLPKLRNRIYALLYEYDEPLHVVRTDGGQIGLHRHEGDHGAGKLEGRSHSCVILT